MSLSFLDRERTVASGSYNRWLIPPAALAVHLSIGEVYAFSVFKNPLVDHFGSSLTAIGAIFSIAIVMLGLSAAVLGTWVERVGPRKAMFTSAVCWSSGFGIGALGVATDQLWLVYLGYGFVGGIGLGIGYISPVSTLIKWFPDRPGLATGLAIMGFGGGALIASPLSESLLSAFADKPEDAIVPAFLTLGVLYLGAMLLGAFVVRVPADDWKPEGYTPPTADTAKSMQTTANVTAANGIKTPQFWLLWTVLFCNVTAGIGILEQASPMIQDFFPDIDAKEAAGFVGLLSLANMSGRFIWSSTSDVIGRKPIYMGYLGIGAVLLLRAGLVRDRGHRDLRRDHGRDHLLLRRRLRDRAGLPEGPLRRAGGRRDPRPAADRLGGRRDRGADDRQPGRRLPGGSRQGGPGPLHALALHHGRRPRRRLHREPPDPARGRALSRAHGGADAGRRPEVAIHPPAAA